MSVLGYKKLGKSNTIKDKFNCLICNKEVHKRESKYNYSFCSMELADKFEEIAGFSYAMFKDTLHEPYLYIVLCSEECSKKFYKWKHWKNIHKDNEIESRFSILVNEAIDRRTPIWEAIKESYKEYFRQQLELEEKKREEFRRKYEDNSNKKAISKIGSPLSKKDKKELELFGDGFCLRIK